MLKRMLGLFLTVCLLLPLHVNAAIADIIVDNGDSGFSVTGSWTEKK